MASELIGPRVFRSIASESVEQLPLPLNGAWNGERGESAFTLSDKAKVSFWVGGQR